GFCPGYKLTELCIDQALIACINAGLDPEGIIHHFHVADLEPPGYPTILPQS
ncbi:MAG: hypothetical protein H6Q98_681, partial [Nitrospirae bacterium]|nr:hypothetical protein [Nitrospirota bacterium]